MEHAPTLTSDEDVPVVGVAVRAEAILAVAVGDPGADAAALALRDRVLTARPG